MTEEVASSQETASTNIETTILPLLSICSLTSEYRITKITSETLKEFPKLSEIKELPDIRTDQLRLLIEDCQQSFEKEARILIQHDLSNKEIENLFNNYKEFLIELYTSQVDYFSYPLNSEPSNFDQSWFLDDTMPLDLFSHRNDDGEYLNEHSLSFNVSDFELDHVQISMSSDFIGDATHNSKEFNKDQLPNTLDSNYSGILQNDKLAQKEIESHDNLLTSDFNDFKIIHNFPTDKKHGMTKEAKLLLESLFRIKSSPTNAERKLIAEKCKMTPSQVRIWFSNKRSRSKEKLSKE